MLTRIFGLHGRGKSETLFRLLETCVNEKKQAFLVVPEQQAVTAERTLIDRLGNPANMYIEVINFKRLCNRVFRESGGLAGKVPDKAAGQLAMSHVLTQLADSLSEYGALAADADFALKMLSTVEEMHRCRVTPEALEAISGSVRENGSESLAGKLHDVALAYRGYDAYLSQALDFPGDLLDKLYETLCAFPFFRGKRVFFDSFYGFTAQELAIIGKILPTAEETCITFLCENEKQSDPCFARGTGAARACRRFAEKTGVPVKDVFLTENVKHVPGSALARLSSHFSLTALSEKAPEVPLDGVSLLRCENIYAEARCAVKLVSDLLEKGARPREIAVCARDTAAYDGILDDAFETAGIPFSFDSHVDLSATPVAALVSFAFEVSFTWSLSAVSGYLKTGLSGLSDADADRLDLYIRAWNIHGKAYFHEAWTMNPRGLRETPPDETELSLIGEARDGFLAPLDAFCDALDAAKTASEIARAVYALTGDIARLAGHEHFDDKADGKYLDLLCRALDCLNDTLGEEAMTPQRFYELYRAAVKNMSVGKIPELIDQVRFSPVSLMRTDGVNVVVLLGVNDGVFPAKPESADVFRDRERRLLAKLGVALSDLDEDKAFDELFLAYTALCSARLQAYVLYRAETTAGEELYPSVLVSLLSKMLGIAPTEFDENGAPEDAASDEALFERYLTMPASVEKATVRAYLEEIPAFAARLAAVERADGAAQPLSMATRNALYGDSMTSSYSRLEKYRECPFAYFCTYTLKLAPEPKGRIGAAEHGSIVHKALEELAPVICARAARGEPFAENEPETLVREKLSSLLARLMPDESGALTGRFRHMFEKIEKSLIPLCRLLSEELAVSRFVPVDFELELSERGAVKPVELALENGGTLRIVGKIDRVDVFRDERTGKSWIRITDYKTGATRFDLTDVRRGFNLQMLLYLYTLIKNGSERYGDVYPAGVVYSHVISPAVNEKLAAAGETDFTEPDVASETSGLAVNDFDVVFAMDETGSGRYVPVRLSAGALPEDAKNTLSEDELLRLLDDAARFAADFAGGIACGDKRANPEGAGGRDVCEFCDLRTICPRQ